MAVGLDASGKATAALTKKLEAAGLAGIGVAEAARRYWNFYFVTSFGWDVLRSVCNAVVIVALGGPLLRALTRFQARFSWEWGGPSRE